MKKEQIAALLSLGFTYEDLYNKGILVPAGASAAQAEAAQASAAQAEAAQAEAAPAETAIAAPAEAAPAEAAPASPAPASGNEALVEAINGMKNDIIKAVQQINIAGAERGGNNITMTVEDALDGIVKGVY